jgi:putative endonuclease
LLLAHKRERNTNRRHCEAAKQPKQTYKRSKVASLDTLSNAGLARNDVYWFLLLAHGSKKEILKPVIARSMRSRGATKQTYSRKIMARDKKGYVYMMSNPGDTVVYTGVTSDLKKRVWEHKQRLTDGFTQRYNAIKLVYYEVFDSINDAIAREKQIKAGPRRKKDALIDGFNPARKDLYEEL